MERLGGGRKHQGEAGVEKSGCWRLDGVKNKVRPVLRGGQWRATLNKMEPRDAVHSAAIEVGTLNLFDPLRQKLLLFRVQLISSHKVPLLAAILIMEFVYSAT